MRNLRGIAIDLELVPDCSNHRTRTASPLYAAADAVIVDTTDQTVDEVVAKVMTIIHAKSERSVTS